MSRQIAFSIPIPARYPNCNHFITETRDDQEMQSESNEHNILIPLGFLLECWVKQAIQSSYFQDL
jgi:hypothetical protein